MGHLAPPTRISKDALVSMTIRALGLSLGFCSHVLLSRLLGPADYGRYAIVLGWALIFVIPTRLGLDTAALKFATHYRAEADHGRLATFRAFSLKVMALGALAWASAGCAVAVANAARAGRAVAWPELSAFAFMIFPLAATGYHAVLLRIAGRIVASQFYEQILRPALLMSGLLVLALGGVHIRLIEALAVTVASLWLMLGAVWWHDRKANPCGPATPSKTDRQQWLRTGTTLLGISATQEMMNQADVILLGWAGQPESAALFSAAWRLASLIPFGLVAACMIAGPSIALAHQRGDREGMKRVAVEAAKISTAFAIVIAVLVNGAGGILLGLFGPGFAGASTALLILTMGGLVNAMTGAVAYLLSLTGHEGDFLRIVTVSLMVNILLNLALVPALGATGAAMASATGTSLLNITAAIRVRNRLGINGTIFARMGR